MQRVGSRAAGGGDGPMQLLCAQPVQCGSGALGARTQARPLTSSRFLRGSRKPRVNDSPKQYARESPIEY